MKVKIPTHLTCSHPQPVNLRDITIHFIWYKSLFTFTTCFLLLTTAYHALQQISFFPIILEFQINCHQLLPLTGLTSLTLYVGVRYSFPTAGPALDGDG